MKLPTTQQVNAALRHGVTAGATAFTVLGIIAVVPQDQVAGLIQDLHDIDSGLEQAFGGFSKLFIVLGPAVGVFMAKLAAASASIVSQLKSVTTSNQVKVEGTIVTSPEIADAVPSDKVVSEPKPVK